MWEDTVFLFTSDNGGNPIVGGACRVPARPALSVVWGSVSFKRTSLYLSDLTPTQSSQPTTQPIEQSTPVLTHVLPPSPGAGFNYDFRGVKSTAWEGGVRVPGFIRAPKVSIRLKSAKPPCSSCYYQALDPMQVLLSTALLL